MNIKKFKTTLTAGILAASIILPGMSAFAADSASIKKTVTANKNVTSIVEANDKKVTFSINQVDNADGRIAPNKDSYIENRAVEIDVSDLADATNGEKSFEKSIVNSLGTLLTGEYTFKIEETTTASTADFGWTSVDDRTYYLHVYVKNDGSKTYVVTKTNTGSETEDDKLSEIAFSNTYNKKSVNDSGAANTLTIKKTIDEGDLAYLDPNATYPVTVTITVPSTETTITNDAYTVTEGDVNRTVDTDEKTVTFTKNLKVDETITISNIAVGATYVVSETTSDLDSNFTKVTYTVTEGTTKNTGEDNSMAEKTFKEQSQSVEVHNDFNNITVTGVVTNVAPYVTLVVVAVAAIAAYITIKRRIAM